MNKSTWLMVLLVIGTVAPVLATDDRAPAPDSRSIVALGNGLNGQAAIKAGTEVRLRIKDPIHSGRMKKGDQVSYEVKEDVRGVAGDVLIPAGTPAFGTVESSSGAGAFGKSGSIAVTCDYVQIA